MVSILVGLIMLVNIQPEANSKGIIDYYVSLGFQQNLTMQQYQLATLKSEAEVQEAKGMLYPSLSFEARYTRAGGGRTIELPIGDLLNPVYTTLNQMLAAQGQQPIFPEQIDNEEITFLREQEHETKLELVQPLFHRPLYYNIKIKQQLQLIQQLKHDTVQRELAATIKKAYFTYLKASKVVQLFQKTKPLLQENLRISQKLFKNGKVTEDVVFRSQAEISHLEQQLIEAQKARDLALSHFNFLLNRPLREPVQEINESEMTSLRKHDFQSAQDHALSHREEIKQLHLSQVIAHNALKVDQSSFWPSMTGVVDYGFEGDEYRFSADDDYWIASVVMHWNLFRGGQDRARVKQTRFEQNRLHLQTREIVQQITLQIQEAYDALQVARQKIQATYDRLHSTRQSFEIISKKYEHGISPQIEYLDARTTMTSAEISHIIAKYDYQIDYAGFERAAAYYPLDQGTH